jgi:hypothetical protein
MLVAVIAIGCIIAIIYFSGGVQGLFGSTTKPGKTGPLLPPFAVSYPTSIQECENGGWRTFPQFADQEECKRFVESLEP